MSFNFVVDRIVNGKAYPNLAVWQAEPYTQSWQEFVEHWPRTVPSELIEHCETFDYPYQLWTVDQDYPPNSYYLVSFGFFDFSVDYFGLMSDRVLADIRSGKLRVLFYYHEGDDPWDLFGRLFKLAMSYQLPVGSFKIVSGNTSAEYHNNKHLTYFPCHELLYWRRNYSTTATPINPDPRQKDFTVLSRTHKLWRATVMTDLHRNGLLDNSYWSYGTSTVADDVETLNPIETWPMNIDYAMEQFLQKAPYTCDQLNSEEHNDHALTVTEHYTNSYCNIVLETLYGDAIDKCSGAFLTEKTFKPIKHAQPFIIVGRSGTVQALKDLGYRTFDSVIDTSYDTYNNNAERWTRILQEIAKIKQANKHDWFARCRDDIEHNQNLFLSSKWHRLNTLSEKLQTI